MKSIVNTNNPQKTQQSASQKTFDRLRKKIKSLQKKLERTEKDLDTALQFYHDKILPGKRSLAEAMFELVKIVYEYYKQKKLFSKRERDILKNFLNDKGSTILSILPRNEPNPDLIAIMKQLNGGKFNDPFSEELADLKSNMTDMFEEVGLDLDLSDVNDSDDEMTIMRKLFGAINEAREGAEGFDDDFFKEAPKSKRSIEKELKAKELETIQKKSLGTIYKQLAKALHPDLEQNPVLKAEKAEIMKKVTAAYESNNLHDLLTLEMELMGKMENGENSERMSSEEQIKIYNLILKDQVKELETSIETMYMHPKYLNISQYFDDSTGNSVVSEGIMTMAILHKDLVIDNANFTCAVRDLRSPNGELIIRAIIEANDN